MKKSTKVVSVILILTIIINIIVVLFQSKTYATNGQRISEDIVNINDSKYPGVKAKIQSLQAQYPNWKFKILYTGLDWNTVISNEYTGHGSSPKNLVQYIDNYKGAWICPICGENHPYDNGTWRCASLEAIQYMMDPRNSINADDIFQFEELTYVDCNVNTLSTMTSGTYLSGCEQIIINVAKNSNISPYYLAARLIQEQGVGGSALVRGPYYNAFNIGASGNTDAEIIANGLAYAQKQGWTTLEASIVGGISKIGTYYIHNGQNTLYLQKFDVEATDGLYCNQYQQNIMAPQSEGNMLRKTYNQINSISSSHNFIIPVYENMPSSACSRPNSNGTSNVNVDLVKVNANPTLWVRDAPNGNKNNTKYVVNGEVVTRIEKATTKVGGTYWDKIRKADGTEGYVARETYDGESPYKLYLVPLNEGGSSSGSGSSNNTSGIKGDVNGDGQITSSDYVLIKNHIMGTRILSGNAQKNADYNCDGQITSSDYVLIKNYIMSH